MPPPLKLSYRPELDGIRAIAVIAVITYHIGVFAPSFGYAVGGYVGVDVFFVLSGFLITQQLISVPPQGIRDILQFYGRRILRLVPAICAVLVGVALVSYWVLFPKELSALAKDALLSFGFILNLHLAREVDYFGAAAETKPLLHFWSLCVEVQFYALFPLVVLMLRNNRRAMIYTVVGLCLISFIIAEGLQWFRPNWSFYLFPARGWEFGVGILLALLPMKATRPSFWWEICGLSALIGLICAFYFLESDGNGATYRMIFPVFFTAILIGLSTAAPKLRSYLSASGLVVIGKMSYSLYLWHWPVLVIMSLVMMRALTVGNVVMACVLMVALSWVTWTYVEIPFRKLKPKNFWGVGIVVLILSFGFGVVWAKQGRIQTFSGSVEQALAAEKDSSARAWACAKANHISSYNTPFEPDTTCLPDVDMTYPEGGLVAVLGDSHGHVLIQSLRQQQVPVLQLSHHACAPVLGLEAVDPHTENSTHCPTHNDVTYSYLASHPGVNTVVLVARWPLYFQGTRASFSNGWVEHGLDAAIQPIGFFGGDEARKSAVLKAYTSVADTWLKLGKNVILVYSVPEMAVNVPLLVARKRMLGQNVPPGVDNLEYQNRVKMVHDALNTIEDHPNLTRILPASVLCAKDGAGICTFGDQNGLYYMDDNHLSNHGASKVVEMILQEAPWLALPDQKGN